MQEMKRKHQGNWNSVDKKAHRRAYGSRKILGNVFPRPIPLCFWSFPELLGAPLAFRTRQTKKCFAAIHNVSSVMIQIESKWNELRQDDPE